MKVINTTSGIDAGCEVSRWKNTKKRCTKQTFHHTWRSRISSNEKKLKCVKIDINWDLIHPRAITKETTAMSNRLKQHENVLSQLWNRGFWLFLSRTQTKKPSQDYRNKLKTSHHRLFCVLFWNLSLCNQHFGKVLMIRFLKSYQLGRMTFFLLLIYARFISMWKRILEHLFEAWQEPTENCIQEWKFTRAFNKKRKT
jgi:hypothetical protein